MKRLPVACSFEGLKSTVTAEISNFQECHSQKNACMRVLYPYTVGKILTTYNVPLI